MAFIDLNVLTVYLIQIMNLNLLKILTIRMNRDRGAGVPVPIF